MAMSEDSNQVCQQIGFPALQNGGCFNLSPHDTLSSLGVGGCGLLFTETWDFNFHPSGEILFYILDILKTEYIEAKTPPPPPQQKTLLLSRIRTETKPWLQCIILKVSIKAQ